MHVCLFVRVNNDYYITPMWILVILLDDTGSHDIK